MLFWIEFKDTLVWFYKYDNWQITYLSGFNSRRYTLTWKEFSRKIIEKTTAKLAVLKITQKSEIVGFYLKPVSLNTCFYTIILVKTLCQKSKTRVTFLSCQNIDFTASQDDFKVFRLSKNNFLRIFSLISNQKRHFPSFF